ncbi:MAG: hypothetical protein AABW89_01145 [Nanoarchaeota archaeon]
MVSSKVVGALAVIAVITSIFSIGLVYLSSRNLFSVISGYATSTGEANLTVESVVAINFTTRAINWGSGRVNSGASSAGLNTYETNNVTNGNWTLQNAGGLRIENIGNLNVSLNLSGTKTATQMIGGTSPSYSWNISSFETGSCRNSTGGTSFLPLDNFYNINTSTTEFCRFFQFNNSQDVIRIDFNLTIPSDSLTGALGDTITATAFAAPY